MVSCIVKHGEKEFPVSALLDSGADYSLFNPRVATWLGIKISDGDECEVNVASGEVEKGFFHEVFVELLGRAGIFDHYRIAFEKTNTIFEEL